MPVAAEAKPGKAPGMLPRPTEQIDALWNHRIAGRSEWVVGPVELEMKAN